MAEQQGNEGTVYVLKAVDSDGTPIPGVFDELRAGRARMGWSYQDNLDLRLIMARLEAGEELDEDQLEARRHCRRLLTDVKDGDYLIYPHQPVRRHFTAVRVTGDYDYSPADPALNGDFRSCRPCSVVTPEPINYNDAIVPARLRHLLGIRGAFFRPSDQGLFFEFLRNLPAAGRIQDGSNASSLRRIHSRLQETLPGMLHREFPAADLSRGFCSELLERMDDIYELQEGPGEIGSDIVVTVTHDFLPENVDIRIGVQVFSYGDRVEEWHLNEKLKQLLNGWEHNSLTYGALLTTGECGDEARNRLREHNRDNPNRLVSLIEGVDLADLFLRYFPPGNA
ncbi:MAG: restriction endonuclease [Candidatus Tectomicrobia bacterium]|nr:restriction endonuclease [Candidatus Tectomicrobia bacterium]